MLDLMETYRRAADNLASPPLPLHVEKLILWQTLLLYGHDMGCPFGAAHPFKVSTAKSSSNACTTYVDETTGSG